MNKNKKIIIAVTAVLIIAIICVIAFFIVNNNTQENDKSKLSGVYEKMNEKSVYTYTATLNSKNIKTIKRKNDKARIDLNVDGEKSTDIIKDGNTYLVMADDKKVYKYQNNDIELTELLIDIKETIESQNPQKSKEEIDGKKYECEEYKGISDFSLTEKSEEENSSTKFYFKGKNLEYIKTKINDKEELLKVNISYEDISDSEFEIPSEYEIL